MAHNRNDSLDSMSSLSSLTSISSHSSVETYESLKGDIDCVKQSPDLQKLVLDAKKIINEKFVPDNRRTYKYEKGGKVVSVNLDQVISAMLEHAEECGGEDAERYVASTIVACSKREDVVGTLAAVSVTWLTHFLFIFKTSRSHETQPNQEPHELATPTLETTTSHVGEGVGQRTDSFQEDLMKRAGYKCALTGFQDIAHPSPDQSIPIVYLKACHILRRAIGKFDHKDHKSDSFMSARTTFDILANYTRLPRETFGDLKNSLDNPSNGMMLQSDAHEAYDRFFWCLKSTGKDNEYSVKIFQNAGILCTPQDNLITFTDRSNDFVPPGSSLKRKRPIDLPNPRYLEIHAAIAGVLHISAAGKFFDQLLDEYKDDEGKVPPVRSWPELEKLMEEEALRDSIVESLQSVGVD